MHQNKHTLTSLKQKIFHSNPTKTEFRAHKSSDDYTFGVLVPAPLDSLVVAMAECKGCTFAGWMLPTTTPSRSSTTWINFRVDVMEASPNWPYKFQPVAELGIEGGIGCVYLVFLFNDHT